MGAWAVCCLLCIKHLQSPSKLRQRKMNTMHALHHQQACWRLGSTQRFWALKRNDEFPPKRWGNVARFAVFVSELSHLDAFRDNLDKPWKLIEYNLPLLPGCNCAPAISLSSLCIMEHVRDNSISKNSIPIWDFFRIDHLQLATLLLGNRCFFISYSWSVRCCVLPQSPNPNADLINLILI